VGLLKELGGAEVGKGRVEREGEEEGEMGNLQYQQQQRFRSNVITVVLLGLCFVLSLSLVPEEEEELPKIVIPTADGSEGEEDKGDPMPYFMIIGVVRGGTTSLVRYLEFNPKVCAAVEPNFWNVYQKFNKGYDWYLDEYFPHCSKWPSKPKFTVDKTSSYIYHPQTSAR
jgi:hypothetical protein